MAIKVNRYTDEEKIAIVNEYYLSGKSKEAISRKYYLKGHSTLSKWIAKFAEASNLPQMDKRNQATPKTIEAHRIAELEKEIARLKLKIEAQDIMLDIIKEQTGLDPRKKSGAKQ